MGGGPPDEASGCGEQALSCANWEPMDVLRPADVHVRDAGTEPRGGDTAYEDMLALRVVRDIYRLVLPAMAVTVMAFWALVESRFAGVILAFLRP